MMPTNIMDQLQKINTRIGDAISWFTLLMVLVTLSIVILRYGFNIGWIAVQESVTYMHSIVFMLGMAYTMKQNAHVRVDVFYSTMTPKSKTWVDLIGHVTMLVPMCLFILYSSSDYVFKSWQLFEQSRETGGLPLVYLLKSTIPLMALLLLIETFNSSLLLIKRLKVNK